MNKSVFGSQTKRFLIRGQTGVFSSPMAIMFCIECIISFVHIPPGPEIHTVSNMLTFEILISNSVSNGVQPPVDLLQGLESKATPELQMIPLIRFYQGRDHQTIFFFFNGLEM